MYFLLQQRIKANATNPIVGINERRRSPNQSEFGKAMRHVHVGRFVIFVERLRSLSCLVYSLHLLDSLFNNIALQ